jgi:hypothetical protein
MFMVIVAPVVLLNLPQKRVLSFKFLLKVPSLGVNSISFHGRCLLLGRSQHVGACKDI